MDDFSLVRRAGERAGRSRRAAAACVSGSVPLGQKNFSRIHDNPAGCYRLAETVTIEQDHQPPGNRSRPFTGSLEAAGYRLGVNLTRTQGDAVLFGYVNNSHIHLDLVASQLKTGNGSRAALIGELGMNNHVTLSRLQDSAFDAEGEGEVHAGLVAVTTGDRQSAGAARGDRQPGGGPIPWALWLLFLVLPVGGHGQPWPWCHTDRG